MPNLESYRNVYAASSVLLISMIQCPSQINIAVCCWLFQTMLGMLWTNLKPRCVRQF